MIDARALPSLEDDLTDEERATLGMMPGVRSEQRLGDPIDPDPSFDPDFPVDLEAPIVEGREGIALYKHPEALLLEEPSLWPIVDEWRAGVPREITRADYVRRSHWSLAAWTAMVGAHFRDQDRRMQHATGDAGET